MSCWKIRKSASQTGQACNAAVFCFSNALRYATNGSSSGQAGGDGATPAYPTTSERASAHPAAASGLASDYAAIVANSLGSIEAGRPARAAAHATRPAGASSAAPPRPARASSAATPTAAAFCPDYADSAPALNPECVARNLELVLRRGPRRPAAAAHAPVLSN